MAMESLSQKGKKTRGVNLDHNLESGWKSPFKLLSPVVHTKAIYLHEWWLMRHEEGKGIAVGGFTIRREGFQSSFCSAPIKERHDNSTLEASDGFTIYISGLINRSVTEQNGFPPEVCSHFLNGFPCNWEEHVSEKSTRPSCTNGSFRFSPGCLKDKSYLQRRDLLLSANGVCNEDAISEHLFNDLLEKLKPAIASDDISLVGKSKKPQETGKENHTSPKLNGIRTRNQLRSLQGRNGKLKELETKKKIQKNMLSLLLASST